MLTFDKNFSLEKKIYINKEVMNNLSKAYNLEESKNIKIIRKYLTKELKERVNNPFPNGKPNDLEEKDEYKYWAQSGSVDYFGCSKLIEFFIPKEWGEKEESVYLKLTGDYRGNESFPKDIEITDNYLQIYISTYM